MDCLRQERLNKKSKIVVASILFFCSLCNAEEHAKVTGDSVNVRVRPDINSEIVTQLSLGEGVVVLEKKDEWVKIKAPSHSKCWVYSECISGAEIKTDSANLRCGPGIAFPVLTKLKKGTPINIIEVFGEWVRIEPPVEFGVWVNSKYLKYERCIEEEIIEKPVTEVPIVEEKPQAISVLEEDITGIELVSYAGKLEDLGIIINRPGTYKLISEKGKWICIIKSPTIDVNPYVSRIVRIDGVIISKSSSWGVPVVELKRLQIIK